MIDSAFLKDILDINLFQDIIWNILELKRFVLFYFDLSKSYFGIKKSKNYFLAGNQVFQKNPLIGITDFVRFRLLQQLIRTVQIPKRTKSCDFWIVCNLDVNEKFIRNAMSQISLRLTICLDRTALCDFTGHTLWSMSIRLRKLTSFN